MHTIPMRAVNQSAEQETHYLLNSPLLFGALESLDAEARVCVLDLAPANGQLLDYFSAYHCKLILPGCRDALLALRPPEDESQPPLASVLTSELPLPQYAPLDLILLWDLPNYLDKAVLTALIMHLLAHVAEHTVMHMYLHTRQRMPSQPGDYHLIPKQAVKVELSAPWAATSPKYYQELIHKILAPFRIARGMLLGNGLQEYILRAE